MSRLKETRHIATLKVSSGHRYGVAFRRSTLPDAHVAIAAMYARGNLKEIEAEQFHVIIDMMDHEGLAQAHGFSLDDCSGEVIQGSDGVNSDEGEAA